MQLYEGPDRCLEIIAIPGGNDQGEFIRDWRRKARKRIAGPHIVLSCEHIRGASNTGNSLVEDMCIDHGRIHVLMTQKLLDRSYVVAGFKKVCCK